MYVEDTAYYKGEVGRTRCKVAAQTARPTVKERQNHSIALLRLTSLHFMTLQPEVTISVVSHGQAALVSRLLSDLQKNCEIPFKVILTLNIEETLPFDNAGLGFPIEVIRNSTSKGFAENHNAAFKHAKTGYFCVLNPDIRLNQDPFPALIEQATDPATGVVGPLIVNPSGKIEDSARRFPTPWGILKKLLPGAPSLDYEISLYPFSPDWIGGMFMLFRSELFSRIGGFDEDYFLYYEDVDLCWRFRHEGFRVLLVPSVRAVHDARRESHRQIRYLFWHVESMLRFFWKRYSGRNGRYG